MTTMSVHLKLGAQEIESFLQHLRKWEMNHACADVEVEIDTQDGTALEQVLERIDPPHAYRTIVAAPDNDRHVRARLRG
jgi:hypothetical protein